MIGFSGRTGRGTGMLVATLLLGAGIATAQTFSFTTESDEPTMVGASTDAVSVGGQYWTGSTSTTFADGSTAASTSTCIAMQQPPNGMFAMHGVCDGTGETGTYTSYMGCNPLNEDGSEMGCVGGLIGTSGDVEGRTGSFSMHIKDGAGTGAGLWRE